MEIDEKELTKGQAVLLARAKAVTEAQFQQAREIAEREILGRLDNDNLLRIVQILATNYLASVNKNNG